MDYFYKMLKHFYILKTSPPDSLISPLITIIEMTALALAEGSPVLLSYS